MSTAGMLDYAEHLNSSTDDDAVSFLSAQHRAMTALFLQIAQRPAADVKAALFRRIADSLTIHAALEEVHFYPAVKERRTKELLVESVEEHLGIKRILADMMDVPVTDPMFDAKLNILRTQVEHHVREEENALFPTIRTLFSSDELADLADTMKDELRDIDGTDPRLNVRGQGRVARRFP